MTIGIAAAGPNAGGAILGALGALEPALHGAVGGFVAFAGIDAAGTVLRADVQRGGAAALIAQLAADDPMLAVERAALISSGPDRPEPLAQFVPASSAGIVTGHRFPQGHGRDGVPLGRAVLRLMENGWTVEDALNRVIADNPNSDAGLIALDAGGRLHAADTPRLVSLGDRGAATSNEGSLAVGVLHNAIAPSDGLARFMAAGVIDRMRVGEMYAVVHLHSGTPVHHAPRAGLEIGPDGVVRRVLTPDIVEPGDRPHAFGVGFRTPVWRDGTVVAQAIDDPFLVSENGYVVSIDGRAESLVRTMPTVEEA